MKIRAAFLAANSIWLVLSPPFAFEAFGADEVNATATACRKVKRKAFSHTAQMPQAVTDGSLVFNDFGKFEIDQYAKITRWVEANDPADKRDAQQRDGNRSAMALRAWSNVRGL